MVRIEDVSFSYDGSKQPVLSNCNLTISQGELVLLCGKSGCGKTTLTRLVNGIIPTQTQGTLSGRISIENEEVTNQPIWKTSLSVGSVFQNPKTQFFNLDTTSEMVFGLENIGVEREKISARLREAVSEYQLDNLAGKSVFELSGGEKQKIAIASAYMGNPKIYVLDEPSANLDQEEILRLRNLLQKLKQAGKTILIAEHRVWYLADLLDRAVYMKSGKILREWSRDDFKSLSLKDRAGFGLRSTLAIKVIPHTCQVTHESGLQLKNLHIERNKRVLWDSLSFIAPKGKAVAICGRNGAGKTTLAQCLCGLRKWGRGDIYLDGKRMTPRTLRSNSFLIMQDVNHQLFAESVLSEAQLGNGASDEEALSALRVMQLDAFAESHPMALSGGQKQRLAVVDGCLCQKEILIFDEPTSGLDLDNMKRVGTLIDSLLEQNKIVIVITHDMEFINHLGAIPLIANR